MIQACQRSRQLLPKAGFAGSFGNPTAPAYLSLLRIICKGKHKRNIGAFGYSGVWKVQLFVPKSVAHLSKRELQPFLNKSTFLMCKHGKGASEP
jgi:hypothetical protein